MVRREKGEFLSQNGVIDTHVMVRREGGDCVGPSQRKVVQMRMRSKKQAHKGEGPNDWLVMLLGSTKFTPETTSTLN